MSNPKLCDEELSRRNSRYLATLLSGITLWILIVIRDEELSSILALVIKQLHALLTKTRDEELSRQVMNNSQKRDEELSRVCYKIFLKPSLYGSFRSYTRLPPVFTCSSFL
jgi:hypothetical protein